MNLGDGKGIKTGNEIDKIKELNNQNPKFKMYIKYLKEKAKQENDDD